MTLRKMRVAVGDLRGAMAAAGYPLERADSPAAFAAEGGGPARAHAMWLGSENALAQLGLRRGEEVVAEDLAAALQGQHARTGAQVRRPGSVPMVDRDGVPMVDEHGKPLREAVVNSFDLTFSAPKSVSVVWALAGPELRAEIERAMLAASHGALEHVTRTRPVVQGKAPARDFAASTALHVTARTAKGEEVPSPQLHVHSHLVGVEDEEGALRTPNSSALYKHSAMREAGAVGRALLAAEMERLGFEVEAGTGRGGRYFEIAGVPAALRERMSGRSRDVEAWAAQREAETGERLDNRERARGAAATRTTKGEVSAAAAQASWRAHGEEVEFGPEQIRGRDGERRAERRPEELRERLRTTVLKRLWEEGPTVSLGAAASIAFEFAPHGLSLEEAGTVLRQMQARGELVALDGWRLTSAEIREREIFVRDTVRRAACEARPLSRGAVAKGIKAAEGSLGNGARLEKEQRRAVRELSGGSDWACLTGRAGTGKGPVLEAVAEAHRRDGWQVIATAVDGATTHRLGHQVGASAVTIEQLLHRIRAGEMQVDRQTLILIEEASKVGLRHWEELARIREASGARLIPIGDVEQIGAIESPGMLDVMLEEEAVPVARLTTVRRHRDPLDPSRPHPWLGEHLDHMYYGRATEAIEVLRREGAITMHGTRAEAMVRLVEKWEERRQEHGIEARDAILVVHGSNEEVNEVNQLAQQRRRRAGELRGEGVQASDRRYRLFEGDLVMLREAAYQPRPERQGAERPRRVENGTTGVVTGVDPRRETVTVSFDQPDGEARQVRVDLAELRRRRADPARDPELGSVPALRLAYAGHPFPLQGGTWKYVGALWGHWSQSKEETYSGAARAKHRLDVHTDRESTGWVGTDEERYERIARKLEKPRHQLASITFEETPELVVAARVGEFGPIPELPLATELGEVAEAGGRAERRGPLPPFASLFGGERLAEIGARADALGEEVAALEDEALWSELENARRALELLDRGAALEAGRLERELAQRAAGLERLRQLSARLGTEAAARRGFGGRRGRSEAQRAAAAHGRAGDREEAAIDRLRRREEALRQQGRHPDEWLRGHEATLARGIAAERRLALRGALHSEELGPEPELELATGEPGALDPPGPGLAP